MDEIKLYTDINEKKSDPEIEKLTDQEALIRALDLLDFYAALRSLNTELVEEESDIEWIEVKDLL